MLLFRTKRLVDLIAFSSEFRGEFLDVGETSFEFLELNKQPRELLVALCRTVRETNGARHRLSKHGHLDDDLGSPLRARELFAAALDDRAGAVQLPEDGAQSLEDLGALSRIFDRKIGDDLAEQREPLSHESEFLFVRANIGSLHDRRHRSCERVEIDRQRCERLAA